jgi:hypothetical protein
MQRHGISIGIEKLHDKIFITMKAIGILTHEDYELIIPIIDKALLSQKDVEADILMDVSDFEGWELRAAWDDFKIGLKHGNDFRKIALYGHNAWQEKLSKIADWFTSGKIQYFQSEKEALLWLQE